MLHVGIQVNPGPRATARVVTGVWQHHSRVVAAAHQNDPASRPRLSSQRQLRKILARGHERDGAASELETPDRARCSNATQSLHDLAAQAQSPCCQWEHHRCALKPRGNKRLGPRALGCRLQPHRRPYGAWRDHLRGVLGQGRFRRCAVTMPQPRSETYRSRRALGPQQASNRCGSTARRSAVESPVGGIAEPHKT